MDWDAIKAEYVSTKISYARLAEKYKISNSTLTQRACREKWSHARKEYRSKVEEEALNKSILKDVIKLTEIQRVALKLLEKLESTVDQQRYIDAKGLKAYTGALKDLMEIGGCRSELDLEEQKARIANLRKMAEKEKSENKNAAIEIIGDESRWSE